MSTDHDRDPALSALWREHSTETPAPHVDAAILAAAHRAVGSGPRRRGRWPVTRAWRWWMPLAAAAVVGAVVVGVKPPSQTGLDDAAQTASDMPAAAPESRLAPPTRQESVLAPSERRVKAVETPPAPPDPTMQRQSAPVPSAGPHPERAAPGARVPSAAADAIAPPRSPKLEAERAQPFAPPPAGAAAVGSSAAPSQPASPAARDDKVDALEREVWIARIRALRELGREEEASRELARFRTAFADADARLPADLREWAKTVR